MRLTPDEHRTQTRGRWTVAAYFILGAALLVSTSPGVVESLAFLFIFTPQLWILFQRIPAPDPTEPNRRELLAWTQLLQRQPTDSSTPWSTTLTGVRVTFDPEAPSLVFHTPDIAPAFKPVGLPEDVNRTEEGLALGRPPTDDETIALLLAARPELSSDPERLPELTLSADLSLPGSLRVAALARAARAAATDDRARIAWRDAYRAGATHGVALAVARDAGGELVADLLRDDADRALTRPRLVLDDALVAALAKVAAPQDEPRLLAMLDRVWERDALLEALSRVGGRATLDRLPTSWTGWTPTERRRAQQALDVIRARVGGGGGALTVPQATGALTLAPPPSALTTPDSPPDV